MIYDDLLQAQLFASTAIKALLSKDVLHPTAPALYNDLVVPEALGKEATTINFYGVQPPNTEGYGSEAFNLSCRAKSMSESLTLAKTVRTELHRTNNPANDTLFICDIQRTLSPFDVTDNYNTVVQIRLTTRALR